jgi:hypothetical protein
MMILNRVAFFQNRRDEVPNQVLAAELAETGNEEGIRQIADNLRNPTPAIAADCLKVLYEVGYRRPDLIAGYYRDFLGLLGSRNNRLVWGGMIALATIARLRAHELFPAAETVKAAMAVGSVITVDAGVKVLAAVAAADGAYLQSLFPFLLAHLESCRPRDLPPHAEEILICLDDEHRGAFVQVLQARLAELTPTQARRLSKVAMQAASRQA